MVMHWQQGQSWQKFLTTFILSQTNRFLVISKVLWLMRWLPRGFEWARCMTRPTLGGG